MTWMRPGRRFLIENLDEEGTLIEVHIEQVHYKGLKALVRFPRGGTMWVPTRHLIDPERR